jgi:hypothetical protein
MSTKAEKEYASQWRLANPDRSRSYWEKFHAANPTAGRAATDKWQAGHQDQVRANYQVRRCRRYGVTTEWFRDQLVGQAGRCAICWQVMTPGRGTNIDHDHVTGKVRALLCSSCNWVIGHAKESPETLRAAASYIEQGALTNAEAD